MTISGYHLSEQSRQRAEQWPGAHFRPTSEQRDWLRLEDRLVLWRAANQIGKSYAQAWDIVAVARGNHPYRATPRAPVRILVVSYSWEQMDPLLEKLWLFLPKAEIDPKVRYEPGDGLRGYKTPHVTFIDGPGKGSVIYFATYKQGSKRIAGGSYHLIILDEPPPESVWGEIRPRINRYDGQIRVSLTPTPDSPPLQYLRAKVEAGEVVEHQTTLTTEAVTPRGGLFERPWMNQTQIDAFVRDCLPVERAMRVEGSWDPVVAGRYLDNYGPHCLDNSPPPEGARLCVGIDYGTQAGKQRASLVALSAENDLHPEVWVWDECGSDGMSTVEQDAASVLSMLRRNGLSWQDIDVWIGDRSVEAQKMGVYKSNRLLVEHLAHQVGVPASRFPRIRTPRKFAGSVGFGFRLMNGIMGRTHADGAGHFHVHPRCVVFDEAAKTYRGRREDPAKDPLDTVRYIMESEVKVGGAIGSYRVTYG